MLKIGVIGLGDIAQKAYLPLLTSRNAELHLCTRDPERLAEIGKKYRITNLHDSISSLINNGISAAFVHTSTTSHEEIIELLLQNNIHVYVDKPITYNYVSAERLTILAESKNLILMTGFNRRYAPSYKKLKDLNDINMVIMQKNRMSLPGDIRTFVFDDFIHVIDTVRFLFPHPVKDVLITGRRDAGLLHHAIIQFIAGNGTTAIGIMNRDAGTVEEIVEVFTPSEKVSVYDVSDTVIASNRDKTKMGSNDWDPTLLKRGFERIIDDFLNAVKTGSQSGISMRDSLATHEICEKAVAELSGI